MTKLAMIALLAAGCTEHGSGGNPDAATPLETPKFQPQICIDGAPGDPSCPVNNVGLELGDGRGQLSFVVQALGSGLVLTGVTLEAGPFGFRVQGLTLRLWVTPTTPMDFPFGMDFALAAGQAATLEPRTFVGQSATVPFSISATSAGPFQPL